MEKRSMVNWSAEKWSTRKKRPWKKGQGKLNHGGTMVHTVYEERSAIDLSCYVDSLDVSHFSFVHLLGLYSTLP